MRYNHQKFKPFPPGTAKMPGDKIPRLGPEGASFQLPAEDLSRQAIAALRGYAYQLHQSAAAWIELKDNEQLYLEVAEDFARVASDANKGDAVLEAVQVKDTRESGAVTLNSADVKDAIRHLFALQRANPDRIVKLSFLTTSPVGSERLMPLPSGRRGILAWQEAADGGDVAEVRNAIVQRFTDDELGVFVRKASDDQLRSQLLERLAFLCDSADWQAVAKRNRRLLQMRRDEVLATWDTALQAYDAIVGYVLSKVLSSDRMLDSKQFLECFFRATSIAMPSQLVVGLATGSQRWVREAEIVKEGTPLSYRRTAEIDPNCITPLLASQGDVYIRYSEEISRVIDKLRGRDRRPEVFFGQIPRLRSLTDVAEREKRASELHSDNANLLRKVEALEDHNQRDLVQLLVYLRKFEATDTQARKAIATFAAIAACKIIRGLKRGFDWIDDQPRFWFEGFKFNSDPSYCLFDWLPRPSATGHAIFGYRYWVGARVGCERQYEYVMFPAKFVLPIFCGAVRGDSDAFFAWVLPQLLLIGHHYPIDQFPVADWEAFLLQGASGREWWSRHQPSPWPIITDNISGAEL